LLSGISGAVHYRQGVESVQRMIDSWESLKTRVDSRRHREVAEKLAIQLNDANKWRDVCVAYFRSYAEPWNSPGVVDTE
jgi:alpha-glucuronidase